MLYLQDRRKQGLQRVANSQQCVFEFCATEADTACVAQAAGADRVELCVDLDVGGLTPPPALLESTVRAVTIPVRVLIRPRAGDFVYTASEFAQMQREVQMARDLGAAGIVLGVLQADGRVDSKRTGELVRLAGPMGVTFHRAFDETVDLSAALEAAIDTGVDCVLTSGGAPDVEQGSAHILELVQQAGDRVGMMAGGGLRLRNMRSVLRNSGVRMVHGSLRQPDKLPGAALPAGDRLTVLADEVRQVLRILREECGNPSVPA